MDYPLKFFLAIFCTALSASRCKENQQNQLPTRGTLNRDILGPKHDFIFQIAKGEIVHFDREADIFSEWGTFSINLEKQKNLKQLIPLLKKSAVSNGWKYDKTACDRFVYSTIADLPGCTQLRYRFNPKGHTEFLLHLAHEKKNLKIFYRLDGS